MLNNPRKLAGLMGVVATIGNLFVIGYLIEIRSFSEFVSILPTSPHFIFITAGTFISLVVTALLFSPVNFNKKAKGAILGVSVLFLIAATIQTSIAMLFILFWPWSLFKFYGSEEI